MSIGPSTLTRPHGDSAAQQHAYSVRGMAHFALTGPIGTTCGGCEHHAKGSSPCAKFRSMTGQHNSPGIPANTPSCKYWVKR